MKRTFTFEQVVILAHWLTHGLATEERQVIELLATLSHEQYTQLYDAYESTK